MFLFALFLCVRARGGSAVIGVQRWVCSSKCAAAGIELCEEFFDFPDLFSGHILFLGPFYVFSSSSRLISL